MWWAYVVAAILCNITINNGQTIQTTYNAGELLSQIFNVNITNQPRSGYGLTHEDQTLTGDERKYIIPFNNQEDNKFRFEPDNSFIPGKLGVSNHGYGFVTFQDDNQIGQGVQKKRKRRLKPRVQMPQGPGYVGPVNSGISQFHFGSQPYIGSVYPRPFNGPPRPRPSVASEALSAVTEALTSIALYDDKQCVPRLLCEAASGGVLGSGALQSVSALQPLLTLLSAYSGISSNPLFVFGRAVFLGMSSKNNPASCRYAYTLCPTDPEQLVYYLNNYNGGFFRFFNAQQQGQQNIDQFYNQLTPNYDQLQINPAVHNYGLYSNINNAQNNNEHNGLYQNNQHYGFAFPYDQHRYGLVNNVRFNNGEGDFNNNKRNKIQKRIQNKPESNLDDFDEEYIGNEHTSNYNQQSQDNTKWAFPEIKINNVRVSKGVKFPEKYNIIEDHKHDDFIRNPRGFKFPGRQSNREYNYGSYQSMAAILHNNLNHNHYNYLNSGVFSSNYNEDIDGFDEDEGVRTIYVVRGNGDPNKPEVIRLRSGESIY